jgi:hypothetical protein
MSDGTRNNASSGTNAYISQQTVIGGSRTSRKKRRTGQRCSEQTWQECTVQSVIDHSTSLTMG